MRLAIALVMLAGLLFACERVVDLTPPDAGEVVPDAALSEGVDASLADASVDGHDTLPPDASVIDAL